MSAFKPYRELTTEPPVEGFEQIKIVDAAGSVYATAENQEIADRMVICWNACRKLYSPSAHIEESEAYIKRLETLRKEAVARAEELERTA